MIYNCWLFFCWCWVVLHVSKSKCLNTLDDAVKSELRFWGRISLALACQAPRLEHRRSLTPLIHSHSHHMWAIYRDLSWERKWSQVNPPKELFTQVQERNIGQTLYFIYSILKFDSYVSPMGRLDARSSYSLQFSQQAFVTWTWFTHSSRTSVFLDSGLAV